jgi:threonine aldolase
LGAQRGAIVATVTQSIDLRSDTLTRPTDGMRKAMAEAPVGDDVFGEDPSINQLQERVASLLGKDYALFFPSGTMANQVALQTLTRPGDVVLAGHGAHILRYESGAAAALAGLQIQTLGTTGIFDEADVREAVPAKDPHRAPVSVVAVENTHNAGGGRIFPLDRIRRIAAAGRERGLRVHLDGARLWNASVATGVPLAEWAEPFDTVSCCLSKGLGAPVGSLVATSDAFAEKLHFFRKRMGGGMRQAGIVAAGGLYALEHHFARLAEDHDNARLLATGLREHGFEVEDPETNIVMFRCDAGPAFVDAARAEGVLLIAFEATRFRAVTHLGIDAESIERALPALVRARERAA